MKTTIGGIEVFGRSARAFSGKSAVCDRCGLVEHTPSETTFPGAAEHFRALGWRVTGNDATADVVCPACVANHL